MVYVTQICWQLASRIRTELHPDPARQLSWHIPLLCVQWKTPDDGHWNYPKHVEFYSKNKFEKLVHLVGFIIRIYHDIRPPERQICVRLYNPPSYSIGRHVFFSRNLSGLSGGAVISLTLVTTDVVYFNSLCWHIQIAAYGRVFENVSTASFSARVGLVTSEL